jgi:hypothetical protein
MCWAGQAAADHRHHEQAGGAGPAGDDSRVHGCSSHLQPVQVSTASHVLFPMSLRKLKDAARVSRRPLCGQA